MVIRVWNVSRCGNLYAVVFDQEKKVFTAGGYTAIPEMEFEVRTSDMVQKIREKLMDLGYKEV